MRRLVVGTTALVALGALTACGGIRGELTNVDVTIPEIRFIAQDDGDIAGADDVDIAAGQVTAEPFHFAATELGTGRLVLGRDLYGERPLMLLFSIPSCPACGAEAPELAAAARRHPEVNFVIAHSQGSVGQITAFNAGHGLGDLDNVIHLDDADMALWVRFSVVAQPYYVLVDRRGALSSSTGALGQDGLDRAVAKLTGT